MVALCAVLARILVPFPNTGAVFTSIRTLIYASILASCAVLQIGLSLYARRTAVERSIGSFKYVLGVEQRKTSDSLTTKADIFLAGIVQLLCVVLADALCQRRLFRRIRALTA